MILLANQWHNPPALQQQTAIVATDVPSCGLTLAACRDVAFGSSVKPLAARACPHALL